MSVDGVLYRHWKQRAEKAEAERDALQDQLDALLANGPEPRVWLEYRREAKAMRDIVERAARMGLCSQTGHEHLMAAARAALTPPAPAASGDLSVGTMSDAEWEAFQPAEPEGGAA